MTASSELYDKIVIKGNLIDQQSPGSKTYKGFSTVSTNSLSFALYDLDLIKQDLLNHFHIRLGEMLERPTFGTVIWDKLFEPMTEQLREIIKNDVNRIIAFEPRVVAKKIEISQEYDKSSRGHGLKIECQLEYLPYHIIDTMRIKFDSANQLMLY
jgi:phage baseplate assembly protein W